MRLATDAELLAMYGAGKQAAFTVLYQRHIGPLTGLLLQRCGNEQTAQDKAHDAITALSEGIDTFDIDRPLRPYLLKMARNAIAGEKRKRKPVEFSTLDNVGYAFDPADPKGDEPNDIAELMEDRQGVLRALDSMEPKYAKPVRLRYFHGLTNKEGAKCLDIPERTFGHRVIIGLRLLRRAMRR